MKSYSFAFVALSSILRFGGGSPAFADTASANCEVRKDGDSRKGATGPCTFSQRQGYIDLDLKKGDSYSLTPTDRPTGQVSTVTRRATRSRPVPSAHRYRALVRPSFLVAWLLLAWVPASADADDLVAAHLAALHDSLDARAAAALDRIESLGPRLLAARSYLRSAAHLAERWSWTQAQIDAYEGSPAQAALDAEISRVRAAFEAANAGYTLFVNPRVRSLDVQLQHWNENRSVADAGNDLLEALREIVGAGGFPAPGSQEARNRFSQALKAHQPQPTPALAAPGLSPHGQMHAVDFQVRQGEITVAGTSTEQVQAVWLGQGWRDRLGSAIRRASDKFRGPLQNPDEPWHYDYRP